MRCVCVADKDLLQGVWSPAVCWQRHEPCINLYYIQLVDCRRVETFGLVKVVVSSRFFKKRSFTLLKIKTQARLDFFLFLILTNSFFHRLLIFCSLSFIVLLMRLSSGIMLLRDALFLSCARLIFKLFISLTVCFSDAWNACEKHGLNILAKVKILYVCLPFSHKWRCWHASAHLPVGINKKACIRMDTGLCIFEAFISSKHQLILLRPWISQPS